MADTGFRFLDPPTPNDRVVAVALDGSITAEGMKIVVQRLQAIVDRGEKALVYMDMTGWSGTELGAATEKLKHLGMLWSALEKQAIVGESAWLPVWTKIADPLTPQHVRHFTPAEAASAWDWLLTAEAEESAETSPA